MSEAETCEFVRQQLAEWSPQLAEDIGGLVYAGTGGTPVWVATYCQLIMDELPVVATRDEVARWLHVVHDIATIDDKRPPSIESWLPRFRQSVDDMAEQIVDKRIRLFDQLLVLRRVTNPDALVSEPANRGNLALLAELFDIGNDEAMRLYRWLHGCAFMTAFDDDEQLGVRMHALIKEAARSFHLTYASGTDRELYDKAEGYYRKIVHFDDELDERSAWLAWSRYEDADWQRNSQDWLYYAAYVSNHAFDGTTEALIRLFLEVFWWWDCQVRSEYCSTLLTYYRALVETRDGDADTRGRDHQWLENLEGFYDNYVSGWGEIPGRHPKNWKGAQGALTALWRKYELDTQPMPNAERDIRRMQILLCIFRADAARYRSVDGVATAAALYAAGAAACVTEDEQWIANWAIFHQADVLSETDPNVAILLTADLPSLIDAVPDHELRTHLIRLYADLAWRRGDVALALDIHARAVLHSFAFQVRQELARQAPSAYTEVIYQEMRTRIERRLAEAKAAGLIDVVDAATDRMRAFFAPYWREVGGEPNNAYGLPPGPSKEDLNKFDTDYFKDVEWVIVNMEDQLNEPVDAPLTP